MRLSYICFLLILTVVVACSSDDTQTAMQTETTEVVEKTIDKDVSQESEDTSKEKNDNSEKNQEDTKQDVDTSTGEQTPPTDVASNAPKDFVLAYNFNKNAQDAGPHNHTTKVVNVSYSEGRKDSQQQAIVLSSSKKSYVEVAHTNFISLNKAMTLSIWYYYTKQTDNGFRTIVEKSNPDDGGHSRYGMWLYDGGTVQLCIEPDTCPTSLCQECIDTSVKMKENSWNHIVGVFDGENLSLYLNGTQSASNNIGSAGISQTQFELFFGTDKYGSPSFLDGKIDDFKLYNRPLSNNEITALYKE